MSDKELIEQLAKEHLRIGDVYECRGVIEFEEYDYGNYIELSYERLEAFAKAYAQTQGQSNAVLVDRGALTMVIQALRRDALQGKVIRGEMADALTSAPIERDK
jgi:hypothetical protein